MDADTGEVNVDYVKNFEVENGKSETIFNETKTLVKEDLKLVTFVGFGSDSCKVMIGKKSGVATRLKEIKPDLTNVHCHYHRLALAAKDSFESLKEFRDSDDVLTHI